ncbi:MAG: M48 family metalloprotease [Alcaligenaceae bacterium]|jgi:putative metalloprotease|nr:M48 family metalloprotease [Alcaligenaceae bacterium]
MSKKVLVAAALCLSLSACETMNIAGMVGAASTLASAASISDSDVTALGLRAQQQLDAENKVAPANNAYAKRLNKITRNLQSYEGRQLNYQVYLTDEVNAFALPNGGVRVYSGLMDRMTDDELLYVIGHEIGHVMMGHSKQQTRANMMSSAALQALSSSGTTVGALSSGAIGQLGHQLVNAQYSQAHEYEADAYGLKILKQQGKSKDAAASALRKLAAIGGNNSSMFSSHPNPSARADRIDKMD